MTFEEFKAATNLLNVAELDKVLYLSYFYHKVEGTRDFSREDVAKWFEALHLNKPNLARLMTRIQSSRSFIRGKDKSHFRIHATELDRLQVEFPGLRSGSAEVTSTDTVLPREIYDNSRGFIESLSKQLNASYEYNIYDGCAVLMRRLMEVLLILSYEHHGIQTAIQDANGEYLRLVSIISDAEQNRTLAMSKDTRKVLDKFRTLGNLSAHKIYYNCRRADLEGIAVSYRVAVEELLYKSGIRK